MAAQNPEMVDQPALAEKGGVENIWPVRGVTSLHSLLALDGSSVSDGVPVSFLFIVQVRSPLKAMKGTLTLLMFSLLLLASALIHIAHSRDASEPAAPQRRQDGNDLFLKNCAACHGKDGRAKTFKAKFNHARNLTDPAWQASSTDEHIYESILKGKKKMPAFEKKLSKDEIGALVTYVRMLKKV